MPKILTGEAREFWKRNASQMQTDGRLTEATFDAFVSLCLMWARYLAAEADGIEPIKIVALSKQVQNGMAAFGMTPASRKRLKLDERKADIGKLIRDAIGGADDGDQS